MADEPQVTRDLNLETNIVQAGAQSVRVRAVNGQLVVPPTAEILRFAQERSGYERPVRLHIVDTADLQAREEQEDTINYLAWRIAYGANAPRALELRGQALGHAVACHYLLGLAEEIDTEAGN